MRLLLLSLLLALVVVAPASAQDSYLDSDGDGYFDPVPAEQVDDCPDEPGPNQGCPPPDTDGDGFRDDVDNCVNIPNQSQIDTDSDGEGNACDSDDDGDGRADADDYDPLDANVQDPPGEVLWTGDGENPIGQDWSSIHTADPYCSVSPQNGIAPNDHGGYFARVSSNPTPLQGQYTYRAKVDDTIDCYQERSELTQTGSNNTKQFDPGTESWEAFGVWLGSDFDLARDLQGASTFYQHKPVPSDNPNASIKVGKGIFQWTTQGGSPTNPDKDVMTIGNATRGDWYRFVIHTKYRYDNTGLIELYSDVPGGPGGDIVLTRSENKPTLYNNTEAIRTNYGFYRESGDSGKETFALDGYAVGTTREIVEENAFGG